MNKIIFTTFFAAFLTFGCDSKNSESSVSSQITDSVTQAYPSAVNDQITDSVTQSIIPNQSTTENLSDYPPHQDPLDQSSANYITYYPKGWSVAASEDWFVSKSKVPYTELSLVNPSRSMLFTLLTENTSKTVDQYVATQQSFVKDLGFKETSLQQIKINGIDYWLLTTPNSSYNNWQWITVQGNRATVLGCGASKGVTPSYESCLDVVLGSAPDFTNSSL